LPKVREFLCRKDIAYAAAFDPKDTYVIKKDMKLVQLGRKSPKTFFKNFERYYNDQTTPNFEPLKLGRSGNKLVNEGLTQLAASQVGKSSRVFNVYAIGKGEAAVNIRNDALTDEITRINILDNAGTLINRGTTCYYSVFFPKTISDVTVKETAILDSLIQSEDLMLLRTLFPPADQIPHVKDRDDIFVGHIIYSGSV